MNKNNFESETESFTAIALTTVQGKPTVALVTVKNNELTSVVPVNPNRPSSALEEILSVMSQLKEQLYDYEP